MSIRVLLLAFASSHMTELLIKDKFPATVRREVGALVPIPTLLPFTNKVLLTLSLVALISEAFKLPETLTFPTTSKASFGLAVPMPTLPSFVILATSAMPAPLLLVRNLIFPAF